MWRSSVRRPVGGLASSKSRLVGGILGRAFGEIQSSDLRAAIVHETLVGHETGHGGDRHDVALLCFQHAREELLDQDEVGGEVDFEYSVVQFGIGVEDRGASG